MPENELALSNDNQGELNIDATNQKPDSEFNKWVHDPSPIEFAIYQAHGGYRKVRIPKRSIVQGEEQIEWLEDYDIDKINRDIDEGGCNKIAGAQAPFVSPNSAVSWLTVPQIYDIAKGTARALRYQLRRDYADGNKYHMKLDSLPKITSHVKATIFVLLCKAKEGFTEKQLTETLISTYVNRAGAGIPLQMHQEGIRDKIASAFGMGKK